MNDMSISKYWLLNIVFLLNWPKLSKVFGDWARFFRRFAQLSKKKIQDYIPKWSFLMHSKSKNLKNFWRFAPECYLMLKLRFQRFERRIFRTFSSKNGAFQRSEQNFSLLSKIFLRLCSIEQGSRSKKNGD